MTVTPSNGFPDGYFIIRSVANGRLMDVGADEMEDGTEVLLWPEKETSLVESRRSPDANNQVFFIDTSGALCSRSSGHAIDVEGDRLVLRHRRPVSLPFPNSYAHPLPKFIYSKETGEITLQFACNPTYPSSSTSSSNAWKRNTYVLATIPIRKPRTLIDNASAFISSALTSPLSLLAGSSNTATPEDVASNGIDLAEDEVLETERGEEAEADDSPELRRDVRVLTIHNKSTDDLELGEKAKNRRRWQIIQLRTVNRRTGGD